MKKYRQLGLAILSLALWGLVLPDLAVHATSESWPLTQSLVKPQARGAPRGAMGEFSRESLDSPVIVQALDAVNGATNRLENSDKTSDSNQPGEGNADSTSEEKPGNPSGDKGGESNGPKEGDQASPKEKERNPEEGNPSNSPKDNGPEFEGKETNPDRDNQPGHEPGDQPGDKKEDQSDDKKGDQPGHEPDDRPDDKKDDKPGDEEGDKPAPPPQEDERDKPSDSSENQPLVPKEPQESDQIDASLELKEDKSVLLTLETSLEQVVGYSIDGQHYQETPRFSLSIREANLGKVFVKNRAGAIFYRQIDAYALLDTAYPTMEEVKTIFTKGQSPIDLVIKDDLGHLHVTASWINTAGQEVAREDLQGDFFQSHFQLAVPEGDFEGKIRLQIADVSHQLELEIPQVIVDAQAPKVEWHLPATIYRNSQFPLDLWDKDQLAGWELYVNDCLVGDNKQLEKPLYEINPVDQTINHMSLKACWKSGKLVFRVKAWDRVGNVLDQVVGESQVDQEAPQLEIAGPKDSPYVNQAQVIHLKVLDENLDKETFQVSLGQGQTPTALHWESIPGGYQAQLVLDQDGDYLISIKAQDQAGNQSQNSLAPFSLDQEAPQILGDLPQESSFSSDSYSFNLRIAEPHLQTVALYQGQEETQGLLHQVASNQYQIRLTKEGSYQLRLVVSDQAGNQTALDLPRLTIDQRAPQISLVRSDSAPYTNQKQNIQLTIQDANLMPEAIAVSLGQGQTLTALHWESIPGGYQAQLVLDQDGDYLISLQAQDQAGNQSQTSLAPFSLDQEAPQILGDLPQESSFSSDSYSFNLRLAEPHLKTVALYQGQEETQGLLHQVASNQYQIRLTKEGSYQLRLVVSDQAGNQTALDLPRLTIDQRAPQISIEGIDEGSYRRQPVQLVLSVWDDYLSSASYRIERLGPDGQIDSREGNFDAQGGPRLVLNEEFDRDGRYQLFLSGTDRVGHRVSLERAFVLDQAGPSLQLSIEGEADQKQTDKRLELTIKGLSPIQEGQFFLSRDGQLIKEEVLVLNQMEAGLFVSHLLWPSLTADGQYRLTLSGQDASGHALKLEREIAFAIDKTAPDLLFVTETSDSLHSEAKTLLFGAYDAQGLSKITIYLDRQAIYTRDNLAGPRLQDQVSFLVTAESALLRFVLVDSAGNVLIKEQTAWGLQPVSEEKILAGGEQSEKKAPAETSPSLFFNGPKEEALEGKGVPSAEPAFPLPYLACWIILALVGLVGFYKGMKHS